MEGSSLKLIAPALFVLLFLSSMGHEVLGSRTEMLKEVTDGYSSSSGEVQGSRTAGILKDMTEKKYSMSEVAEVVAEMAAVMAANNGNEGLKNALLRAEAMQCVGINSYCNTLFGPKCCSGITCVQGPIVGGVCKKW